MATETTTYALETTADLMDHVRVCVETVGDAKCATLASLLKQAGSVDALKNAIDACAAITAPGAVSPRISVEADNARMSGLAFVDGLFARGSGAAKDARTRASFLARTLCASDTAE